MTRLSQGFNSLPAGFGHGELVRAEGLTLLPELGAVHGLVPEVAGFCPVVGRGNAKPPPTAQPSPLRLAPGREPPVEATSFGCDMSLRRELVAEGRGSKRQPITDVL